MPPTRTSPFPGDSRGRKERRTRPLCRKEEITLKVFSKLEVLFFYDSMVLSVDKNKGPHTKPDKLGGGLRGGLTNSDQKEPRGWSEREASS